MQQFIDEHNMAALTSVHTGIQCVLYPWCYRPYDANDPKDAEIPFMKETAAKMAQVYQDYTGRGFYSMSSNEDYATSAEMIDYSFGRYNIHSYTIEVYSPGKSESRRHQRLHVGEQYARGQVGLLRLRRDPGEARS